MIQHIYPTIPGTTTPGPCVRCGVHYGPDNGECELPANMEPGVIYPAPYAPKFPFQIIKRGEDHFVAFDVETITERARRQVVALEEEAILEAVVAWLRAHGYTVTGPGDERVIEAREALAEFQGKFGADTFGWTHRIVSAMEGLLS